MTAIIDMESVTKTYGKTVALDGFGITVEAGQVHGFLGPNGAGKTTTMRVLLGLLRIQAGKATVFGLDPWKDVAQIHARLTYVPGDVSFWPNLTGGEILDVLARLHGTTGDREHWLEFFDLDPTKKARTYSKGNRQKVALVGAFSAGAELMVLDEPTSGLDPLVNEAFVHAIEKERERGTTIFLSSHIMSEVDRLCDHVSIIKAGRLVESGPMSEFRDGGRSLEQAFLEHFGGEA